MNIILSSFLFMNVVLAQTFEEYESVEQKLNSLNEKCRTSFTNEECNNEREYLRGQLKDWSEKPEIEIRKKIKLRLNAFDHARAYCEKEKLMGKDQAMQFEIRMFKAELEKDRLKLDRKKFCYCRADRRLRAFGKEGAGSFYVLNDDLTLNSHLPAETISEIRNLEKEIFISCFEHPEIVPAGAGNLSLETKLARVNDELLSSSRGTQTVYRFELNKGFSVNGVDLLLESFERSENVITAVFKDRNNTSYRAQAKSDRKGGTFLEGFPLRDKFAQVVRFVPDRAVTLKISR